MSAARIARGSAAKPRARSSAKGGARGKKPSGIAATLPVSADAVRRLSWWMFAAVMAALAIASAVALQVPQMIGLSIGEAIGRAGFSLKSVEIKGAERVARVDVYNVAYDQPSSAMPLVDLDGTRERLLRFGWVKEARVSRRLPDTLVVDIVERTPAAIWQNNRRLMLIDASGVLLEPIALDAMPDLPIVIGPGANAQAGDLGAMLAAAPSIKPMLAGATWIGGRRWDLRFQSGETLALPEGREAAERALVRFARMDRQTQLLGRGLVRFDMRIPGKFIVRVSREPGSTVPALAPEAPPPEPGAGPVDPTRTI